MAASPDIVLVREQVSAAELARLVALHFQDMVKFVVDVEREVAALGGELHADAEQVLIEDGSSSSDVWGGNYYPGRGPADCIEFTALINIRPSRGNRTMTLQDPALRERVRGLAFRLIGRGEALA